MSLIAPIARSLRQASRIQQIRPRPCIQRSFQPRTYTTATRLLSSKSHADIVIEDITELYATARDEFEIAMEETEKATVYAEDDRKAAQEELAKVKDAYKKIIEGNDKQLADEVSRRIGQRIRELEQGVQRMEEMALEHD